MYFFLSQLAFMDLCQVFSVVPQMTLNFITQNYTISLYGCVIQIFVTLVLGGAECFILATMSYDRSNVIDHIACEYMTLMQLSCSDTSAFEKATYLGDFLAFLLPITVILASYIAILLQVLRARSSERSYKALGTCLSHLFVVGLFYGASILTYMTPISSYSAQKAMINSVFTTVFPAMMNPFIYSLRNKDVLGALRKLFTKYGLQK
ncbi:UNVERIFIED_CONTAM: hypothetical protein K2H54_059465 [Gekko kuhli]